MRRSLRQKLVHRFWVGRRALRWLGALARPYASLLPIAAVAMLLSGAISLVVPMVAGRVVDAAAVERNLDRLGEVILWLFALFAVAAVMRYTHTYILRSTAARLLRDLRAKLHSHFLSLPPSFFETERVGELLSRLNSDVSTIGNVLTRDLINGLQQGLVLVGGVTVLIVIHPRLTGMMLIAVPPVIVAAVFFGWRFEALSKKQQKCLADTNVVAEESLAGIRTVQAFARENEERARYRGKLETMLEVALQAARVWGGFGAVVSFFIFAALTSVLWYGGSLVVEGALTVGQLTSFLLYTLTVAGTVASVMAVYGAVKSSVGATERIRDLLDTPADIADPAEPVDLPGALGRIEFRGVRFAYRSEPERPAIDGVSFEIDRGEVVALVGPSGGGKSTLASLLLRFHDPQEGQVAIDGIDVRDFRLAELRGAIGMVAQDVFLFGGTIADNLRFGNPEATDEQIRDAARAARVETFVAALPQGYETPVGERGIRLSTGERQRIAIARVLLKDPAIVVLDEATSALDAESEHDVQMALERLFDRRTILVIAHRFSTVSRADRVLLLDGGHLVEQGTHEHLMQLSGTYRRLHELQQLDVT